ncbi:MAG: helix-turn-helix transcriptional regulator, partial [Candidatus Mucispirillum faecigallinarum]|nr:helix-turn-helix transcriptional regulator [Candidatus Mucispirillum faecigallinarum]
IIYSMENQIIFKNIKQKLQKNIAQLRKTRNLTQEELAEKCEMSVKSISDIETNRRGVSLLSLIKILYVMDIDLNKLIISEEKDNE